MQYNKILEITSSIIQIRIIMIRTGNQERIISNARMTPHLRSNMHSVGIMLGVTQICYMRFLIMCEEISVLWGKIRVFERVK